MNTTVIGKPTSEIIGNLTIDIPFLSSTDTGKTLFELFDNMPTLEGVVVLEGKYPIGLIMRNRFFQKIAEKYGYSIYMNRQISLLIDSTPMIIDYYQDIGKVGIMAMNREHDNLYDFILVSKNNEYVGAVSIRLFLIELSRKSNEKLEILKLQHENLRKANDQERELRLKLSENHMKLQLKSASIKNLLDNAGQGFLSFGRDFMIEEDYSLECENIIGYSLKEVSYLDLISKIFPEDKVPFQHLALKSYFESQSRITDDAYLQLLPRDLKIGYKTIRFEYKRIEFLGDKKIMVVMTDITEKVIMERNLEVEGKKQRLVIKALTSAEEFKSSIEEMRVFFKTEALYILENGNNLVESLNEIFRLVHTFKGDFAQFGLFNSSKKLHIIEDEFQIYLNQYETINKEEIIHFIDEIDPKKIIKEDVSIITNILGNDYFKDNDKILVTKEAIFDIENRITNLCSEDECNKLLPSIHKLRYKNIKEMMEQYNDYIEYLSERTGKEIPQYVVTGDDVWINKEPYVKFFKSIVHLFRNICDHGLENPEERIAAGKEAVGIITCEIVSDINNQIFIKLSDDGRGIDYRIIKEKAILKGLFSKKQLDSMSEKEILNIIFQQGFSTKLQVSTLSGRGVGMSAIKEAVEALNGTIEIETAIGKGTSYFMKIPII